MKRAPPYSWTLSKVRAAAEPYQHLKDFRKYEPAAYDRAKDYKWGSSRLVVGCSESMMG